MKGDQHGHKRFAGGTIYCPRAQRRFHLGLNHGYPDEYVCPGCNVRIPARKVKR